MRPSAQLPGIVIDIRAPAAGAGVADVPCTSCLFDAAAASGMAGAEPCPLKARLLRRATQTRPESGHATMPSCAGFAATCADTGDDWSSDLPDDPRRILS